MNVRFRGGTLAVGAAVVLVLGALAGCAASPTQPQTQSPVVDVDFTSALQSGKATVVQTSVGGKIVVTAPSGAQLAATLWNASIANPAILTFSPANFSGPAASMPLFTAIKAGHTTAVLTYTSPSPAQQITLDVTIVGS